MKNPHTVDGAHRDPAELLAECRTAQAAVAREKLKRELQIALASKV